MKYVKIIGFILAVLFAVSFAACAAPQPAPEPAKTEPAAPAAPEKAPEPEKTPEAPAPEPEKPAEDPMITKIKARGKLILATSPDYPPYEFPIVGKDGKQQIVGFDIRIAEEIAKDLGVELEIMGMSFDGLLAALQAGSADIVIAGMTPTEERKQAVDFSDIYYYAKQGVLVRAADKEKYAALDSFKGKKVGAQKGAIQEELAKELLTGAKVIALKQIQALVLELTTKKVEGVVMEKPVAENYVSQYPDLAVSDIVLQEDVGGSAVGMLKGSDGLRELVNATLKRLIDNGDIDKFIVEAIEMQADAAL